MSDQVPLAISLDVRCPHIEGGACWTCIDPQMVIAMNAGIVMGVNASLNAVKRLSDGDCTPEDFDELIATLTGKTGFWRPRERKNASASPECDKIRGEVDGGA